MTNNQHVDEDIDHFFDFFAYTINTEAGEKFPALIDKDYEDYTTRNTFIDFNADSYRITLKRKDLQRLNIDETTTLMLGSCSFRLNNIKTLGSGVISAQIIVLSGDIYGF